eukprot:symbB.v1.2.028594.t1/scaffold3046.1/size64741/4
MGSYCSGPYCSGPDDEDVLSESEEEETIQPPLAPSFVFAGWMIDPVQVRSPVPKAATMPGPPATRFHHPLPSDRVEYDNLKQCETPVEDGEKAGAETHDNFEALLQSMQVQVDKLGIVMDLGDLRELHGPSQKRRFRSLQLKWHPDKTGGATTEQFQFLQMMSEGSFQ